MFMSDYHSRLIPGTTLGTEDIVTKIENKVHDLMESTFFYRSHV